MLRIFGIHREKIYLCILKLSLTVRKFTTSNISCHNGWQILLKHLLIRQLFLDSLANNVIAADKKHLKIFSAKMSKQFSFSLSSTDITPHSKENKQTDKQTNCTAEENQFKIYSFEKVKFIIFQLINWKQVSMRFSWQRHNLPINKCITGKNYSQLTLKHAWRQMAQIKRTLTRPLNGIQVNNKSITACWFKEYLSSTLNIYIYTL